MHCSKRTESVTASCVSIIPVACYVCCVALIVHGCNVLRCLSADGSSSQAEGGGGQRETIPEPEPPEDSSTLPAVVIYLIDPFSYGQEWSELHRLAMVGLLRCYQQMLLPPHLHNSTFLHVGGLWIWIWIYTLQEPVNGCKRDGTGRAQNFLVLHKACTSTLL